MSSGPRGRLEDAGRAFDVVRHSPSLARAELAFGATCVAEWAFTIGLGIVAFQDGGASRVGFVAALRLLPSAALAPVAATVADRWPRERVLAASSMLLGVATSVSAVVLAADGPVVLVYVLAALATVALTPYRAAHSALQPSLCRTTDDLAAANIVRGTLDSVSVFAGPLLASGLIELTELWCVFAATAAVAAVAAGLVANLPYERPLQVAATPRGTLSVEVVAGLRAAAANADALWLMGFAGVQTFLRGALNVFTVVLALDVLDTGESGVGVLQSAMGVGAIMGSIGAARLLGSGRMGAWMGLGVAMWGIPICIIGAVTEQWSALSMIAAIGVANAVLDVALFTMLGRLVADEVLARVFGVFETLVATTVALGSLTAAAAIDLVGVRGAMGLLGAAAPLAIALGWSQLTRIDDLLAFRQQELDVLQRVPMLRALPVPMIEHLARRITPRQVRPGEVIIREGTLGTRYYVIADGEVEVREHGQLLRTMGPGEGFGEIALLRHVRRTTDVRARPDGPVTLYGLDREDFVASVAGYSHAATAAADTMSVWDKPSEGLVADDGDPFHDAAGGEEVVGDDVLRGPVVPERDRPG